MGMDYKKVKARSEAEGSFWTSYSDLFMVLSVVFLLLYVVATLKNGTSSIQKHIEFKQMRAQSEDLKKQIQAYNALKDDYLEKEASPDEAKMYEDLMGKLTLLQDEATDEKKALEEKARENELKAVALNKYQQMVRNIINTNLLSNKKIKFRNEVIEKKNEAITEMDSTIQTQSKDLTEKSRLITEKERLITQQDQEIQQKQAILDQKKAEVASLEVAVREKAETIAQNQAKIQNLNSNLNQQVEQFEKVSKSAKMSQVELNRKIALMKLENAKKIGQLQSQTQQMKSAVEGMNQELASAEGQLNAARGKIAEQEGLKRKLEADIAEASTNHQKKLAELRQGFEDKIAGERAALEAQLGKEKASAAEKIKRLAAFKDKVAGEKAQLDRELANVRQQADGLKGELANVQGKNEGLKNQLDQAKADHGKYLAAIGQLEKDKQGLSGDLKRAQELANAKKKLSETIAANLRKNGINAGVDGKSGEVTIEFGDEYFDTGRADLKNNMKEILKKFVPTYSKSLFQDEKVSKELASVEIIGFSSPTYKGRYVDPQSLSENDRAAVSYNLDLSYNRAKSIFSYIFDKKNMNYTYQKELLPLVKVTGRSFLAEGVKSRDIASALTIKDYCTQYNCAKSQKVIIRFNLKD
jgi:chromosome segregation ATPase